MCKFNVDPPYGADVSFLWPQHNRNLPVQYAPGEVVHRRWQLVEGASMQVDEIVEPWELRWRSQRLEATITRALGGDLSDATRWTDFEGEARRLYHKQAEEMKHLFSFQGLEWQHSIRSETFGTSDLDFTDSRSQLWEIQAELKECSKKLKETCWALGTEEELKNKLRAALEILRTKMDDRAEEEWLYTRLNEIASKRQGQWRVAKAFYDLQSSLGPLVTGLRDEHLSGKQQQNPSMEEQWISCDPRRVRDELMESHRRIQEMDLQIEAMMEKFHELFNTLVIVLEIQSRRERLEEALEEALQRSDALMDTLSRFVLWLLEILFRTLQSLGKFFEFPDRRRPPCTTMPWNIWPALIILWGVCWMFYPPDFSNDFFAPGTQDIAESETAISHTFDNFDWVANFFPQGPQAIENSQASWKDSNAPRDSEWHPLYVANQEFGDTAGTQSASSSAPVSSASVMPGLKTPPGHSLDTDLMSSSANEVRHSIERPQTPNLVAYTYSARIATSYPFIESGSDDPLADAPADAPGPKPLPLTIQTPNRNSEGKIICTFPKCERFSFDQPSEWRQHIDIHHRCTVAGCKRTEIFTAKGQLDRHQRSVHGIGRKALHYCEKPGCPRGPGGEGFVRRDDMLQHARRHRDEPAPGTAENLYGTNDAGRALAGLRDPVTRSGQDLQRTAGNNLYAHSHRHDSRGRSPTTGPPTRATLNPNVSSHFPYLQHDTERLSIDRMPSLLSSIPNGNPRGETQSIHKRRRIPDAESDYEVGETANTVKKLKSDNDALLSENQELKAEVARLKGVIRHMANAF